MIVLAAALPAILSAAFALLLGLASGQLTKALRSLFSNAGGIGGTILKGLESGVGALEAGAKRTFQPTATKVLGILQPIRTVLATIIGSHTDAIQHFGKFSKLIVLTKIPKATSTAKTYASNKVAALSARVTYLHNAAIAAAHGARAAAQRYAAAQAAAAKTYAANKVAALSARVTYLHNAAIAAAHGARAAAQRYADAQRDAAEAKAAAATAKLQATVTRNHTAMLADVKAARVAATRAATAAAHADTVTQVRGLSTSVATAAAPGWHYVADLAGDLADATKAGMPSQSALYADIPTAVPTTAAAAAGAATAVLRAVLRTTKECTIPNCKNLSQVGREAADLGDLIGSAAFLAWLAEGVRNPAGWAGTTNDVFGPIGNDAATAAAHLVGVG